MLKCRFCLRAQRLYGVQFSLLVKMQRLILAWIILLKINLATYICVSAASTDDKFVTMYL